ncbi:TIGR03854 family LLM class F420-dependent oxidoreductase [Saccharomonospora sp. NPDC006951]
MKIRIGVGIGPQAELSEFATIVDDLERENIDSLWLSETLSSTQPDPFTGMTYALARTQRLKVGTGVAVLPGRHPAHVAKQLTTLAALAPARVLPVFGLRPARRHELAAFPAPLGRRAELFDETLRALRLLLTEDDVTFSGEFFRFEHLSTGPKPAKPLDLWLGGAAPEGLRRVGRYADGWLASFITPTAAELGRRTIETAAEEAGREIEDDHYGLTFAIAFGEIPERLLAFAAARSGKADPRELIAVGWQGARELIERHIDAGLSKFVLRPASSSIPFGRFVEEFTHELLPLQN